MLIQQICPTKQIMDIELLSCIHSKCYDIAPFDPQIAAFSGRLSKRILADKVFGRVPALAALAFWLRPSNLNRIAKENHHLTANSNVFLSPIGIVFHVCPANVDTMFIYSLMISLLMGNKNILRVSNRLDHEYISFLFDLINDELATEESKTIRNYINVVTYQHEQDVNAFFAQNANARLIWGGDNTAKTFKSIFGNPRCKDIVFADRLSIALFNTKAFIEDTSANQQKTAKAFYNDSYTFDQKGCSSPQTIFLYGNMDANKQFVNIFYNLLEDISNTQYGGDNASLASLKFNQLVGDVIESDVNFYRNDAATLYMVSTLTPTLQHSCGGGYFYVKEINSLAHIVDFINNKVQTISYFGLNQNELLELAKQTAGIGVDRFVPIGKSLDFDYIWDGYNLCEELSSKKYIA